MISPRHLRGGKSSKLGSSSQGRASGSLVKMLRAPGRPLPVRMPRWVIRRMAAILKGEGLELLPVTNMGQAILSVTRATCWTGLLGRTLIDLHGTTLAPVHPVAHVPEFTRQGSLGRFSFVSAWEGVE